MGLLNQVFNFSKEEKFNPGHFKDDFAKQISWEPLVSGGASFRTHKAVQVHYKRIEFKPTITSKVFPFIFILTPFFILYQVGVYKNFSFYEYFIELLVSLLFIIIGLIFLFKLGKPIVFDQSFGFFWKGKYDPRAITETNKHHYVKLEDIYALQIIKEWNSGSKNSSGFHSYELNLILKNKTRHNVIDHGSLRNLRKDAEIISAFLKIPVWDGV